MSKLFTATSYGKTVSNLKLTLAKMLISTEMKQFFALVILTCGLISASFAQTATFAYSGSIVTWTVPTGVTAVNITAAGAQGGSNGGTGGVGAIMNGTFAVTAGQVFTILVGQQPTGGSFAGGGGGTFVALGATYSTATPLIVAGGGGGATSGTGGAASTGTSGNGPVPGTGGNGAATTSCGGGGGGFYTSGGNDSYYGYGGGQGFRQGGAGGTNPGYQSGGFGGGAAADYIGSCNQEGGSGGGYSGGSGYNSTGLLYTGWGGGSYNGGTNQINTTGNTGNGYVTINYGVAVNYSYSGTIPTWTVPANVTSINVFTAGAQGGSNGGTGGAGALLNGTFAVTAGQVLSLLVGQQPTGGSFAGGGGGTFVALGGTYSTATAMIVAGGGGGATSGTGGVASITTSGNGPVPGTSGNGAARTTCGGGGGGFLTSGGNDLDYNYGGGAGFRQGGAGGTNPGYQSGGFGGGAAADYIGSCNQEGGSGGGYSGGSGYNSTGLLYTGWGGGSYNGGTYQVNATGQSGNGYITIIYYVNCTSASVASVSGGGSPCIGATTTCTANSVVLSGGTGAWSSSNTGVATVNTSGVVTGVAGGSANIIYTITGGCGGTVSAYQTITVQSNASIASVTGTSPICVGGSATYSANSLVTGGGTGAWSSSNTGIATVNSSGVVTGVAAGTCNIIYTISGGCSGTKSALQAVTVNSPSSTGSWGYPTLYGCYGTGGGTTYTAAGVATAQTITGYTGNIIGWGFGSDGVTCTNNTSGFPGNAGVATCPWGCCFSAPGNATVMMVEVQNPGCAAVYSCFTPTYNTISNPTGGSVVGSVSGNNAGCASSGNITLTATGGSTGAISGGRFQWFSGSCGGTAVGTGSSLTIAAPSGTTSYYVEAFDVCNGTGTCYGPITYTITSNASIASVTGGATPLCVGGTTTCTANSIVTGGGTGAWSSSNPSVATVNSSGLVTAVAGGSANIIYTITGGCGGTKSAFQTINVVGITAQPVSTTTCSGTAFSALSVTASGSPTYQWYENFTGDANGAQLLSGQTSSTYTPISTAPGSAALYYVVVSGVCTSNVVTATVDLPAAAISSPANTFSSITSGGSLVLTASGGTTYSWSTTATTAAVTVTAAGTYTVTVKDANNCTAAANRVITVNEVPSALALTGTTTICPGKTTQLIEPFALATGGNSVTTVNGYRVHTFTSGGTFATTSAINAEVLAVGGGGGGGSAIGGGGGAGGVIYESNQPFAASSSYTIAVGGGGNGGQNGSSNTAVCQGSTGSASTISTIGLSAAGGGGGGSYWPNTSGYNGGSGGGAGGTQGNTLTGGSATGSVLGTGGTGTIYGGAGGSLVDTRISFYNTSAAGGGGAGGAARNVLTSDPNANRAGGTGVAFDISGSGIGTLVYYGGGGGAGACCGSTATGGAGGGGGGGGGSSYAGTAGAGGAGGGSAGAGGGANTNGGNAAANTGGGGGGAGWNTDIGGNGGSGIVIIRYPDLTAGTWSSNNTAVATVNSTGQVTGVAGGTATISYVVTSNGITSTVTATITVNPAVTVAVTPTAGTTYCSYANSGVLTATPGGGTSPFTYAWSNGLGSGSTATPTLSSSTAYTVTVTDTKGCSVVGTTGAVVVNPAVTASPTPAATTKLCSYSTVGALAAGAGGGTSPYTYLWSNGLGTSSNATPTITTGTVYNVTVTDSKGCSVTANTGSISIDALVTASASPSATTTYCPYATSGVLTVSPGGGTGVYTYAWSNSLGSSSSATPTSTSAIVYTVTVTDNNGCSVAANTGSVNVDPAITVSPTPNSTSLICSYNTTGALAAGAGGGVSPYTYSWSNGLGTSASATPSLTTATTYNVTVTDSKSCTASANTGAITVDPAVTSNATPSTTTIYCPYNTAGGLTAGAGGGTAGYTYSWSNGLGTGATATPTLTTGTVYHVTVTDSKGCTVLGTTGTVTVNPAITVNPTPNSTTLICPYNATNALAAVAGGGTSPYTYSWTNSLGTGATATPSITSATVYTVTVTDHNNCTASGNTGSITVDPNMTVSPTSTTGEYICSYANTGALSANVSGGVAGYTYTWSNSLGNASTATPTITSATTYTITATDTKGCTASGSVGPIIDYSPPTITNTTPGFICGTGTVNLGATASAGVVNWYTASSGGSAVSSGAGSYTTPIISANTTYWVDATANGCTTTSRTSVLATVYATTISSGGFYYMASATDPGQSTLISSGTQVTSTNAVNAGVVTQTLSSGLIPCTKYWYATYIVTNGVIEYASTADASFTTGTVNSSIASVSGTASLCIGASATYSANSVVLGSGTGAWSSSNTGIATVNSSGVVTAVAAGSCNIIYTITGGCNGTVSALQALIVTPNASIASVTGTSSICIGASTTYTANTIVTGGGTGAWSSDNTGVATVNTSGVVTGVTAGGANIIYTITGGCGGTVTKSAAITISPNASVASVTGTSTICIGASTTYTANSIVTSGGTGAWSSSNTAVATVNTSGVVTGVTAGSANIIYTVTGGCGGTASALRPITISPNASIGSVSGTSTICIGASTTYTANSAVTSGGTGAWSSSNTAVATVNTSGVVTGVTAGSANIIYTITGGCGGTISALQPVTISPNASIASVTGTTAICIGASTTYAANSVVTSGGTGAWSSSNTAVATVNTSGVVTGVTAGSSNIIYTITGGCGGTASALQAITINPNASIGSVTGTATICIGASTTYTANSAVAGGGTGAWSSSNTAVATVNTSGLVTGVTAGSANIIYTITGGCGGTVTKSVAITISPNASIASVTGTSTICIGASTTYTANSIVTSGGTGAWSSSNTAVATVNTSGVVTGVTAGSANIIYTVTGGCGGTASALQPITISPNASIGSVSGTSTICIGASTTYTANSAVTSGGTGAWSSSNTAVATVNTSGVVTGVTAGSANIIYTITGGCGGTVSALQAITISPNASVGSVSGVSALCVSGSTTTYTANSVVYSGGSGAWSSSNTSVATVNSSGVVTPLAAGNSNIIYTVTGGCGGTTSALQVVTVDPVVSNYGTITASAGTTQSLCPSVAPAGTFGVSGATGGSGSFTYQWYYQNGIVSAPSGSTIGSWNICTSSQGNNYNVAGFQPFGTTGNISYACLVTPAGAPACVGTATWATGVLQMTVSTPTASIAITTGNPTMCNGGTVTLTASTSFVATWQWYSSSDNITYAPISGQTATTFSPSTASNGLVYYDAIATYTSGSGCSPATSNDEAITVVAQPSITTEPGTANLCLGGSGSLNVVVAGGVGATYQWQYHSGVSYFNVSDNTYPGTGYTYGGTGTSNPLVTTASSSATASTYQYRVQVGFLAGSGCNAVTSSNGSLQVAALPSITTQPPSALTVCAGSSTNISIVSGGGISLSNEWQYYNSGTSTWGDVTNGTPLGVNYSGTSPLAISTNNGSTTPAGAYQYRCIVNSTGNNCTPVTSTTTTVTVNPVMAISSVSGTSPLCIGGSTTYTNSGVVLGGTGSGAWSSNNTSVATVNTSGVVTAAGAGTCNIIYTVSGGCGSTVSAQQSLTVNPNASIASVTGTSALCVGGTATFNANSIVLGGGTGAWSSTNTSVATVNSSGLVTAVGVGSCNIEYTITGGCGGTVSALQSLIINTGASIASVSGSSPVCIGGTTTYTANSVALGGGTGAWSSDNTSVATVNSSGVVTGVAAGTADIIYTITGGCGGTVSAQKTVTISPNASIASVNGSSPICISGTTTYTANTVVLSGGSGAWSSSNTSIATVNSLGVVTGIASGSANIIYTITSGCGGTVSALQAVTISPNASIASVSGSSPLCIGGTTTFTANSPVYNGGSGAWSSSNTSIATVNSSGVVTGVAAGSANIIYTITGGCGGTVSALQAVTISPNASISSVSGSSPVCIGGTTTYTANSPVYSGGSGAWSSSNTSVATVNSSGVVTGVAAGSANIIYTITGGCGGTVSALQAVVINPNASIASVSGSSPICISGTTTFTANSVVLSGGSGAWSSSNTSVATVNSSGVVTGVASGSANIVYTVTGGCGGTVSALQAISVSPGASIASVSGTSPLCIFGTTTYTANSIVLSGGSGAWSSSNTSVATVNSSGVVTAVASGSANIVYTITGGCGGTVSALQAVTISPNASIASVSGASPVCIGGTTTYTANSPVYSGGTGAWSSDNTSVATVNSSGVVTGVAAGSANIIYTITGGCGGLISSQQTVTVSPNASIASVSGASSLCIGGTSGFSTNSVVLSGGSGAWSSDNTSVATVNSLGLVSGVAPGTANIIYTITSGCGGTVSAQQGVTVNPGASIASVTGATALCVGGTATYTANSVVLSGGSGGWSSDNTSVATVNSSGVVTGVSSGTANIKYTIAGGCGGTVSAQQLITINTGASIASVSGVSSLCIAGTSTFTANSVVLGGGTGAWSSSNASIATVNSSGVVTGIAGGSANIIYTVTGGCGGTVSALQSITINQGASIASVSGSSPVCISGTTTFAANSVVLGGGTGAWSSDNASIASVNSSGVVSGVSPGTANIIYTITGGCGGTISAQHGVTISPNASIASVTGSSPLCSGSTTTYTANSVVLSGGTGAWSSDNTSVATVNSSGVVTAVSSGSANIVYTITSGCGGTVSSQQSISVGAASVTSYAGFSPTICGGSDGYITLSGLSNSATYSVTYDKNSSPVGPVNFTTDGSGVLTIGALTAGSYNNIIVTLGSCSSVPVPASGNITISNPSAPTAYAVTGGTNCGSATIGLAFSQSGYNYQLLLNGSNVSGGIVAGSLTNGAISFGSQTTAGIYTVITTTCPVTMNGSAIVHASPTVYTVTGGANCGGSAVIGLSSSDVGVNYQLILSGSTNVGSALAGTGSALNFGTQTMAGSYTVMATDATTLCTAVTSGSNSASVYGTANIYNVSSTNDCSSIIVSLSNSDLGINYALILGGTSQVGSLISGTGGSITFPSATTSGSYTVQATVGSCNTTMNGSGTLVSTAPTAYTVTGGLNNCGQALIGLNGSQSNISYQLVLNGNTNIGAAVVGTGSAFNFGNEFTQGNYTVVATSATNCRTTMTGNSSITSGALLMVAPGIVRGVSSPVCQGTNITATFTSGSGGTSAALETHEYSVNGGNSWATYTPGSNISTTSISGLNIVQIRTQRYDPTSTCYVSNYNYAYWNVGSSSTAPSSLSVSASDNPVCSGTTSTLTFTVNGGSLGSNARWVLYASNPTVGNPAPVASSATSTLTAPQPLTANTYTYYVRAESFGTCVTSTVSANITVLQSPDVLINANDATSICTGGSVSLHLTSNDPNVTGFTWTIGSITGGVTGANAGSGTTISDSPLDLGSTYNFGSVTYVITAHDASATCPSLVDNQVISLNRQVLLTSPATVTTCNSDVVYTPTSNISGATFAWSRPAVTGINPSTGESGSGNINDAVTNTTTSPVTFDYTITITSGCGNVNATVSATVNPALGTATPTIYVDNCGLGSELGLSSLTGGNGVPNYTVYFTDETYNIHYTDVVSTLPITLTTPAYGDYYSIDSMKDADGCEVILGGTITAQAPVLDDTATSVPCTITSTPLTFYNATQLGNGHGVNAAFIAKVVPTGNSLNSTTTNLGVFVTSPNYGGNQHFMRRNVQITPANQSSANVTIYISQTDVDSLVAASLNDPFPYKPLLSDLSNLGVSRFDGGSEDPASFTSRTNFHHNSVSVTPNDPLPGVYAVTFSTSGFSGMQMNSDPSVASEITGTATTCPGQATQLTVNLFGIGPWKFQIVDQLGNVVDDESAVGVGTAGATSFTYHFNVSPTVNTTYTVTNLTDADDPNDQPPYYKGSAVISVNTASTVTASGGSTICPYGTVTLTSSVTSADVPYITGYQWQSSTDGVNYSPVGGATSSTYSPTITSAGNVYYEVAVTYSSGSGVCSPSVSNATTVVVTQPLSITGPSSASQTVCTGNSQAPTAISVTPSGGAGTVSYQWYSNTNNSNSGGSPIGSLTTSASFIPPATLGTTYYYVEASTPVSGCVAPVTSSSYSTVIVDGLTATAGNSGPYCAAGSIAVTATPTPAGTYTYSWSNSGDGFSSTSQNATDNAGNGGGTYQVVVSDNNCSITATTNVTLNSNLINSFTPTVASNPICASVTGGGTTVDIASSQTIVTYQLETSTGTLIGSPTPGTTSNNGKLSLSTGPISASTTYNVIATAGGCTYTSPNTSVVTMLPDVALGALLPSSSQPLIGQHYDFATLPTSWSAVTNANNNAWTLGSTNNATSTSYEYYNISGLDNGASTAGYVQTPTTTTTPAGTVDLISSTINTTGFTNISVMWGAQRYAGYTGTVSLYYTTDATINGGTVWTPVSYTDIMSNVTGAPWYLINNGVPAKLPHDSHNNANNAAHLTFKWSAPVATDGSSYYALNDVVVYGLGTINNCGQSSITLNYVNSSCNASQYTIGSTNTTWTSGGNTTNWPVWTGLTALNTSGGSVSTHGSVTVNVPSSTTAGTYDVDFTVNDGLGNNSSVLNFPVTTDPAISVTVNLDNCSCNNTGGAFGNVVSTFVAGGTGSYSFSPATTGDVLKTTNGSTGVFWSAADGGLHFFNVNDGQCVTTVKQHTQNGSPTTVPFGSVTGQPISVGGNGVSGSFNNIGEGDPSITNVNGKALTCHQTADFGNAWVTYQVNNLDNSGNPLTGDTTNNTAVVEINNHGVNLDSVSVSVYRDAYLPAIPNAATQTTACYGYVGYAMERHFMIKSTQSTGANVFVENPVGVRLYFTDAEFEDLKYWTMYAATHATGESAGCAYADTVTNMNSIYVTKYTGANEDGNYLNNSQAPSGVYRIFGKTAALPGNGPLSAIDVPGATLQTGQGTNLHYVQMNVTEFSEFWLGGSQDGFALPVEMIYLEAEAMNNDSIQVRWATASEINNREFNVERSTDGNTWTTIGVVAGHGNSTVDNYYVYNDLNVVPEVRYYYRLKQIDNNGSYQYTDVVQAMINGTGAFAVMNFVPNPTSGNTQLTVVATRNQEISVDFYDMLGQKVMSATEQIVAGTNRIDFDLHRFAAGTYSAVVTSENQLYTKKIVITGR